MLKIIPYRIHGIHELFIHVKDRVSKLFLSFHLDISSLHKQTGIVVHDPLRFGPVQEDHHHE